MSRQQQQRQQQQQQQQQQQSRQLLNAVLDTPIANGTQSDEHDMDEEEIKRLAALQEASRKRFDAVLAQPSSHWRSSADVASLQEALVTVLDHIRGESNDAHRMAPASAAVKHDRDQLGSHQSPGNSQSAVDKLNNKKKKLKDGSEGNGNGVENSNNADGIGNGNGTSAVGDGDGDDDDDNDEMAVDEYTDASDGPLRSTETSTIGTGISAAATATVAEKTSTSNTTTTSGGGRKSILSRSKYIPLRLSVGERKLLRLVEAALNVSEYTDVVDVLATRGKTKQRVHSQIRDLCSILTGLAVANDYTAGQKLVADRDFAENEEFFQDAFEIARRHKVANPEKSRDTYGKLIHMLQDSNQDEIRAMLDFSCVKPLRTVYSFLEERNALQLLEDPLIEMATKEIVPEGKTRRVIQSEISQKERAVNTLAKRYRSLRHISDDEIRQCLYSIGDNNAYLRAARDPCDTMIKYLHDFFRSEFKAGIGVDKLNSLSIAEGIGGARLTHDHSRQFMYVYQSLALWREICHDMYRLWYLSETDLLKPRNLYVLRNTGQGLNRVQAAPNVLRCMHEILATVQRRVGSWVGSSVVHLGDYNVPNALVFIDKYAQVQRILGPLCTCIRRIGEVVNDNPAIAKYVQDTFGGVTRARKIILRDFFRYAFDGSGASDWFSAGSCIDGRLTSAWNWCSDVEKKQYWPLMLLTGFTGFDGDF